MCLTDDASLAERLRVFRNHGQSQPGVFECASGNARLSELHAALANVHLRSLDARIERRLQIRSQIENLDMLAGATTSSKRTHQRPNTGSAIPNGRHSRRP